MIDVLGIHLSVAFLLSMDITAWPLAAKLVPHEPIYAVKFVRA